MGYRLPDNPPDMRPRLHDAATQSVITIDNGTISRIMISCHYAHEEHHDRMMHDHVGWPSPGHPDESCQLPPGHDHVLVLDEIDLPGEGYNEIEIAFLNPPDGLEAFGGLGNGLVWLEFDAFCPSLMDADADVRFAAYALGEAEDYHGDESIGLRDVITKGTLHIVGGPFVYSDPDEPLI